VAVPQLGSHPLWPEDMALPSDQPEAAARVAVAQEARALGKAAFQAGQYSSALLHYSQGSRYLDATSVRRPSELELSQHHAMGQERAEVRANM
jgi:hypothetical protein